MTTGISDPDFAKELAASLLIKETEAWLAITRARTRFDEKDLRELQTFLLDVWSILQPEKVEV